MAPCLAEATADPAGNLYPRYLGPPVGLVEVNEDARSAEVIWEATVHRAFSRHGKQWSRGETIPLTTRLVRIDGLWKLVQLYDGDEDGDQRDNTPAN